MTDKQNEIIKDRILNAINNATGKAWNSGLSFSLPQNFATKTKYQGLNMFLLSLAPHKSPYYLTYKQALDLGGQVKKGSKGEMIYKYGTFNPDKDSENDNEKFIPFIKFYTVFNLDQIEGIEYPNPKHQVLSLVDQAKQASHISRRYIEKSEIKFVSGGNEPYYQAQTDTVVIPDVHNYDTDTKYFDTLFHELIHSTGHKNRLDRFDQHNFASDSYSKEELIATCGSAYLCMEIGIFETVIQNMGEYLKAWLDRVKDAKTQTLISAMSQAHKASNYILTIE
jgi:antirestriction protein ArdC